MMKAKFILLAVVLLFGYSCVHAKYRVSMPENSLKEYKVYSLSFCISNNYENMGVDFNKFPLKDNTMGFIDIDAGLGFNKERDNVLDLYIKNKTGHFYKPKQNSGDLASLNMVLYDCVDFYHSKELDVFLRKIINERILEIKNYNRAFNDETE